MDNKILVTRSSMTSLDEYTEANEQSRIEQIYKFYKNHEKACSKEYKLAMDKDISQLYERCEEQDIRTELARVAIVVLTANKFEKNVLHQHAYQKNGLRIKQFTIKLFENPQKHNVTDAYIFVLDGYVVMHIACRVTGSYTLGGCADAVRYCIKNPYLFPMGFISFGICFGCRENNDDLCDVVISDKVYPYFIGAKINGRQLKTSDDFVLHTNSELGNIIDRLKDENKFESPEYNVSYKNFITGEAVISSREIRDIFVGTTTQEIYAGDMEAYALYKECSNAYRNIPCVVVKSICDWGVGKNLVDKPTYEIVIERKDTGDESKLIKDKLQALATSNAFHVLEIMLKEGCFKQSIFDRIMKKFTEETHEHLWGKDRISDEAMHLCKDLDGMIANDYIEALCVELEKAGVAENKERYITRKEGDL